jgi:hypothetical protein
MVQWPLAVNAGDQAGTGRSPSQLLLVGMLIQLLLEFDDDHLRIDLSSVLADVHEKKMTMLRRLSISDIASSADVVRLERPESCQG